MGKRGFAPMSPISVALCLVSWIDMNGRRPNSRDCRNSHELPHHQTFYRLFGSAGSFGIIIAEAERIGRTFLIETQTYSDSTKNIVSFSTISSVKIRTCIGREKNGQDCQVRFPDEGAHIRLCHSCRLRLSGKKGHNIDFIEPAVNRVELRQLFGIYYDGGLQDTIDWNGEKKL